MHRAVFPIAAVIFALIGAAQVLAGCAVPPPFSTNTIQKAIEIDPIERWRCPTDLTLRYWYRTNNEGRANVIDPRLRAACQPIAPVRVPL